VLCVYVRMRAVFTIEPNGTHSSYNSLSLLAVEGSDGPRRASGERRPSMVVAASLLMSGGPQGAGSSHSHLSAASHRHRLSGQSGISDTVPPSEPTVMRRRAVDSSDLRSCAIVQGKLKTLKVFPGG
jgi:hypothetical protein